MMETESIDVAMAIAIVATALTLVCGWPQLRRIRRTGDVSGVSLSTATLGIASEAGWLVYLSGEGLWSAMPESVLTIGVDLLVAVALLRAGARGVQAAGAAGVWCGVLVGSRFIGGPASLAVLLSITYAVQLAPSVWTAWRTWCPTGLATHAWTIRLAQSLLWGAYGALRGDMPLLTLGAIGSAASVAVLARILATRGRRPLISSATIEPAAAASLAADACPPMVEPAVAA